MPENKPLVRWPMYLTIAMILTLLCTTLFTYSVRHTDHAVVLRFGKPIMEKNTDPGLHFKLPFETVWTADNRIQCFEGESGIVEEIFTNDEKNITVTLFMCWKISEDKRLTYLERVGNGPAARLELTALLRSYKNSVFGKYKFEDLVNIDRNKIKIRQIEREILALISIEALDLYGIEVSDIGVTHLGFPETVTKKIFARMEAERETEVQKILSEADIISAKIKTDADRESVKRLANAEAEATRIRAKGDAEAAKHYAVFEQNPELAAYLRKLNSLKQILTEKTTLILDTETAPFDLLKNDGLESNIPTRISQ